jgi:hypothetical protein
MTDDNARVEQFRSDIAGMHLKDPVAGREVNLLRLGVLLMVGGVALTVIAYSASHGTRLDLDQRDDIIAALIGVALTITGAALFIRYSIAQFFRFWLARLIYEQRAATDRLLAGQPVARADGSAEPLAESATETPARA